MKKYLLISEKPSLMRAVKNAYFAGNINKKMQVDFMALHGHVCTLAQPEDYNEAWKKWSMDTLPLMPTTFKHIPTDLPLIKEISAAIKSNDYDGLINCTDAEREGQNIFYSLYDYLKLDLPVLRFWASDLTEDKLILAWNNLRDDLSDPMLTHLTQAALYRAQLDWLVGMNFTRVVSITNNTVIPVGRVMSVVLSILAKREAEIANFKPSTSYGIQAHYSQGFAGDLVDEADNSQSPFNTKQKAQEVLEKLSKKGVIDSIEINNTSRSAPLLYSLADLQNDANKSYGYTLAESLQIVQTLYEKKILSYPRTDSNYLTSGEATRMDQILKAVHCVPCLSDINIDPKKISGYAKTKYVNDAKVQAHYAIVFTGTTFDPSQLSKPENNILQLVGKRIMATLMNPSESQGIKVRVLIDDKPFITNERYLTYAGWESLYDKKEQVVDGTIASLKKGSNITVEQFDITESTTSCPPRYNDASINKAMINVGSLLDDEKLKKALRGEGSKDQGGIGTPATRSGIIEKLVTPRKNGVQWVERKGKSFQVTPQGMDVAAALSPYVISSPELTAEWESKLADIASGEMSAKVFEQQMNDFILDQCEQLKKSKLANAVASKGKGVSILKGAVCPFCGSPICVSEKYYYCAQYKKEKNCTFILGKVTAGAKLSEKDVIKLVSDGETGLKKFKNKEGKQFSAHLAIDHNGSKVAFKFDKDEGKEVGKCSCGGNIMLKKSKKGDNYYTCDSCKKFVMQTVNGHKVSAKECAQLFDGKSVTFKDCVSKAGKKYAARFTMREDGKFDMEFVNN